MQTVRILGIDPGFDRLGVCILDKTGSKETLIFSTCITTSKKDTFGVRIAHVGKELTKIIKEYQPSELAIETLFFTTNQKTIITVAEVRGVCIYVSELFSVKLYEYSPAHIKLAIAGYGKATKEDISFMVSKILKIETKGSALDDEIDAIAVALTHSANRQNKLILQGVV
ncbi:MAG: crossover junction endodeoxyribonuclease RuvC [Candidatus Pacebacteria bacterium]|nr:crossover junction endodeoxyribonuclease RuvC [Candidatus Paceibacterota bacterium]